MSQIKTLIIHFITSLNNKDYNSLGKCFATDVILHRGMKNYVGKDEVVNWYRKQLDSGHLRFELMDATAGILPDGSAMSILWLEIKTRGNEETRMGIHIESLNLIESKSYWEIQKCFGLGFNPEHHKENFHHDTTGCDE